MSIIVWRPASAWFSHHAVNAWTASRGDVLRRRGHLNARKLPHLGLPARGSWNGGADVRQARRWAVPGQCRHSALRRFGAGRRGLVRLFVGAGRHRSRTHRRNRPQPRRLDRAHGRARTPAHGVYGRLIGRTDLSAAIGALQSSACRGTRRHSRQAQSTAARVLDDYFDFLASNGTRKQRQISQHWARYASEPWFHCCAFRATTPHQARSMHGHPQERCLPTTCASMRAASTATSICRFFSFSAARTNWFPTNKRGRSSRSLGAAEIGACAYSRRGTQFRGRARPRTIAADGARILRSPGRLAAAPHRRARLARRLHPHRPRPHLGCMKAGLEVETAVVPASTVLFGHRHKRWHLVLVRAGSLDEEVDGRVHTMSAGGCRISPPNATTIWSSGLRASPARSCPSMTRGLSHSASQSPTYSCAAQRQSIQFPNRDWRGQMDRRPSSRTCRPKGAGDAAR